jgi:hypothetical protein
MGIMLYPNPVQSNTVIEIEVLQPQAVRLQIVDMQGRVIKDRIVSLQKGRHMIPLDPSGLGNGIYVLRTCSNDQWQEVRFRK